MNEKLLDVQDLKTYFFTLYGVVKAVDGVSFGIQKGEALGIVGESGCGKSVTARSIMGLVPKPGKIISGKVIFKGVNLLENEDRIRAMRGSQISMIFQDPTASLNPLFKVGDQIAETIRVHQKLSKREAWDKAIQIMDSVGISNPNNRAEQYPFQFSGGMRQRIMIAIALSCNPSLLIADEPTTNLDVTIQAQIIGLLKNIMVKKNMTLILITHNLGLVAWLCNEVCVMYAGQIVERADVRSILKEPIHPYTRALLRTIPRIDVETEKLLVIEGSVPDLIGIPESCKFSERCRQVKGICEENTPPFVEVKPGHYVRCFQQLGKQKEEE